MNSSLEDILKKHECNNIALEIDLMRHFDVILKEAMDGMVERSNVVDINVPRETVSDEAGDYLPNSLSISTEMKRLKIK